jgi:hypothetical protein
MTTRGRRVAAVVALALLLAGCGLGGGERAGRPPGVAQTPQPSASIAPATSVAPEPESESEAPPTTADPAATGEETEGVGRVRTVDDAVDVVTGKGFRVASTATWKQGNRLRVLIGTADGAAGGYANLAFFFADGKFMGNDTAEPSLSVDVAASDATTVTLRYRLYRASDSLCCPSGGSARVRFRLAGGKVRPLDRIPRPAGAGGTGR